MKYTKIKIESKDDAKRFYRILAVNGNPDLLTLGAIIGESIGAWFEHLYYFISKKNEYVHSSWLDGGFGIYKQYDLKKSYLSDLGSTFSFIYDSGEDWDFKCTVMKREIELEDTDDEDDMPLAFVVDGKGQGIFENDHWTLCRYFDGEIDPESGDDEEKEIFLPMNLSFEKFGDFDSPIDLEEMVYDKSQIELILDGFGEESNPNNEEEDSDLEEEMKYHLLHNEIAGAIFNDPKTNLQFRKLLEKHDLNEAYQITVDCILQAIEESNEEDTEEQFTEKLDNIFAKVL